MKRLLFLISFFILFVSFVGAQSLPLSFAWDASATPGTIENPIKYRLCSTMLPPVGWPVGGLPPDRVIREAGTSLELNTGIMVGTYYFFATAYNYGLTVDGVLDTTKFQESGPSNVLKLVVTAPPGNPLKLRLKSVSIVAGSQSGSTLGVNR
ncbi:hypothetical protein MUP59_11135 [Candidatus Bathyarchaeota archaeon]|nr:hypothetical protein [Candidatus Bathyarchaeota archaeon]